jgi:alcohol dehydrogenase class IV
MGLISYLTTIRFDFGAVSGLGQDLTDLRIERPMIVADAGVVAVGLVERLQEATPALRGATVFDDVPSNPTEEAAETAILRPCRAMPPSSAASRGSPRPSHP